MEALVALGLASNVVQFVDFASKIVSRGVKIYREKPGTDKDPEGSSLEQITKALEGHNRNLVKALDEQSNSTSGAALASPAEQDLVQICVECQKIILKLLDLLEKLKTSKPTAWNSLVAALKTCDELNNVIMNTIGSGTI
ncbi:hypothetical protein P154DRAFT_12837 [Amniculicola lignicola CBS 123094]|uniref:NACHT-NTPase and P-loop NTPases N-terminal domain-containing protein n=1 Tax=Amniculicola lignicola CBS 123094 TaxID=1392246 RepID=A0A6A5X589_9PLEO|nr:hypothetical protein P154DRAFT_12837 [Amniculicola lignicola CBS 123094]